MKAAKESTYLEVPLTHLSEVFGYSADDEFVNFPCVAFAFDDEVGVFV
jgi:hypothetical protein